MKKQRRLLAALLALNLVLGLAAPCAAAGDPTTEPSAQTETPEQTGTETAPEAAPDQEPIPTPEPTPAPEPTPDPEPTTDLESPADTENPSTDPENPGTNPGNLGTDLENPGTDPENPGTDPDNPDTTPETPDNPSENPDAPPETPTTPTEPADPIVPPVSTQEELDAAQKAQEEAAEREALLSQLRELLPEEEQAALEEMSLEELRALKASLDGVREKEELIRQLRELLPEEEQAALEEMSLEELRALKASLDETREKEELIRQLRELLPEEEQAALEAMSLEELRSALSQAEAEKKAEEARLAAEAAEREALLSQLSGLLSPEEYQALTEKGPSLEELRALKTSLEEAQEKEELIQQLREILPEDEQEGLEELSLDELYALLKKAMSAQGLLPMPLADAEILQVTVQNPPPIQINPYGLAIGGSTASLISQPCLITSNTQAEVEVTAVATAIATGGAKLMNQSTRSLEAMAAHKTDDRDIFLFLELKNLAGSDPSAADWTTDPVSFRSSGSAAVIPRSGEGIAKLTIPAAGSSPSYAAFKIGGDCSKPSYMGEWKAGALIDVDGSLEPGEDDGAKITIVFTFTAQVFYNLQFVVQPYEYGPELSDLESIFITVGGEDVPFTAVDNTPNYASERVQALISEDFVVHTGVIPTENHSYYNAIYEITATAGDNSYCLFTAEGKEQMSTEQVFPVGDFSSLPANSDITITVTVLEVYYWI